MTAPKMKPFKGCGYGLIPKGYEPLWGVSHGVCPKCGHKNPGAHTGSTTLMYCLPFVDKEGKDHHHDSNYRELHYECSACPYKWAEFYYAGHCWCGWPENEEAGD